jgi:hypothetical protein
MRFPSIFFALLLIPIGLSAQPSAVYSPPRPSQACPVYMAAHRIGGLAAVQTDAPGLNEAQKQQLNKVLALESQLKPLRQQKSDLEAKLAQNPDTASAASLRQQLADLDLQIDKQRAEAGAATAALNALLSSDRSGHVNAPAPGLDLNIAPMGSQPITAIDILVHGFSNRPHLTGASQLPDAVPPAAQNPNGLGNSQPAAIEPTESFHISRDGAGSSIRTSIVAKGMMGISWLEVTRVEFADGSAWQPTSDAKCRFAPSLYVPVNLTAAPAR